MISVIVPVYNTKKEYLNRCIDSLVRQDYTDFEVLIIDDGSNEDVAIECDKISNTNSCVKVFHKENGGVSSARNFGLDNARGDYIAFVDSDDWVDFDYLSILINGIVENGADIAISGISYEYEDCFDTYHLENVSEKTVKLLNREELLSAVLSSEEIGGFLWNKLFKAEFIKRRLDESIHYCEDLEFVSYYICGIENGVFIDRKTYHYQKNDDSITANGKYNSKVFSILSAYEKIKNIYLMNAPFKVPEIEKNILYMSLQLKKRYKITRGSNKSEYTVIKKTIRKHFLRVFFSKEITNHNRIHLIARLLGIKK